MNRSQLAPLIFCLALTGQGVATEKKIKGEPPTVPPTSPMIAQPAAAATPAITSPQQGKLISSEMSGRDLGFFMKAVEAGRAQAYFIELLKTRASSPDIKALAEALTSTQEEENRHVARLAAVKGWNVSLQPTAAQKKEAAQFDKLSGSNFDKAAMDKLVAASAEAMDAYRGAAQSEDKDIKSFAAQMVPLAEEKRHVIEKMTGAGSKAAAKLFRNSPAPELPAATPSATGKPSPAATSASRNSPAQTAASAPGATPVAKSSPAIKPVSPTKAATLSKATPLPSALPVATPPGATPAPLLSRPPIATPRAFGLETATPIPTPLPR